MGRIIDKGLRKTLLDQYKEDTVRIPIYLLKPAKKYPVQSLYVKQHLRRIDHRGKSEHDKTSQTDDNIDNVTDVLFKDDKLRQECKPRTHTTPKPTQVCKDVFVSAEAGLGKSSLCAHLVRLWCDAHSVPGETSSLSNDPNEERDLQVMKTFKLLFYINLSEEDLPPKQPECDEISHLIHKQSQLEDGGYSRVYIEKCMSEDSTLVVIDSLDECQTDRLPYRGKHNHSCIVTTITPWKLESLRSQIKNKHGHQQVEIVGLEESSSPKFLVENILNIFNREILEDEDKPKDGSQFLDEMIEKGLQDFLYFPMLIIQMLMLWFEEIPFGKSQSEIYSNVIHHQIEVAIKKNKKIHELPEHKGKSVDDFPLFCKKSGCVCKNYRELLWKVAALACDSTDKSFKDLNEKEVDVCLEVGLLTKHIFFVKKMTERGEKSVKKVFPHKTIQEYFAAVHLSYRWSETVKTHLSSIINDLNRAMELDKVLLFCSELNPELKVARKLSRLISVRADGDSRVQEYRQSGKYAGGYHSDAPNRDLIYKIQNIVSAAAQQTAQKSPSEQPAVASTPSTQDRSRSKLILADIILGPQRRRTEKDRTVNVEALDMAAVKSVHIDAEFADVTIWKQARLQTLVVGNGQKTNVENLYGVVVRNQETLRTLGLHGGFDSQLDLSPPENKLADMLTRVKLSDEQCEKLGRHLSLRQLTLSFMTFSDEQCEILCRHLSTSQNLRRLTLSEMTFPHKQCEILCRHLSKSQNLRQLTLDKIECLTHGAGRSRVKAGCCGVKLHRKLELLKLNRLPFNHVSFPADDLKTFEIWLLDNVPAAKSALSCLTSASNLRNLREFKCWDSRDVAFVQELAAVLPQLHGLQRIVLGDIDFGCLREIRLSAAAAKTLESVELWSSTITADGLESLVQSVDAPWVMIELSDVIITDRDPTEFLQRLRDSPDVEVTWDRGVKYEDARWARVAGWKVEWFEFYKNKQQTS